jgi:hypothetical protein
VIEQQQKPHKSENIFLKETKIAENPEKVAREPKREKKKKKVADEDEKCVGKNKVVPERRVHSDGFAELALEKTLNTRARKTKEADQNSDTVIFSLSRLGASGFLQLRLGGTLQSKHELDPGQDSVNGAWSRPQRMDVTTTRCRTKTNRVVASVDHVRFPLAWQVHSIHQRGCQ